MSLSTLPWPCVRSPTIPHVQMFYVRVFFSITLSAPLGQAGTEASSVVLFGCFVPSCSGRAWLSVRSLKIFVQRGATLQIWVFSLRGRALPAGPCFRTHRPPRRLAECLGPLCLDGCPSPSPRSPLKCHPFGVLPSPQWLLSASASGPSRCR